jgi:hypothetical protein
MEAARLRHATVYTVAIMRWLFLGGPVHAASMLGGCRVYGMQW